MDEQAGRTAMVAPAPQSFEALLDAAPVRAFQWLTVGIAMFALVADGIDLQLLGLVAPVVMSDLGVDKATFGFAMSAALVGMGLGAWGGGWAGDRWGRRLALAGSALVFSLATIGASRAGSVWDLAVWRMIGGLGFGAAYVNAMTMGGEWMPERFRAVAITTLSVGTPIGGTIVGALAPTLLADFGWRGTFVLFGCATLSLVVVSLLFLKDSPGFLMVRGHVERAHRNAASVLSEPFVLTGAEAGVAGATGKEAIGVLHRSNLRLNLGIGVAFAASTLVAYGILNWTTTFLTGRGVPLATAAYAVSAAGMTSVFGAVVTGLLCRRFGTRATMIGLSGVLTVVMTLLGWVVETLPQPPTDHSAFLVSAMIAGVATFFSASISAMYVVLAWGYPASCRSAGLGFGMFMGRVGAVAASGFGGTLIQLGAGSLVPFFATLVFGSILIGIGALIVDRHVPPLRARG